MRLTYGDEIPAFAHGTTARSSRETIIASHRIINMAFVDRLRESASCVVHAGTIANSTPWPIVKTGSARELARGDVQQFLVRPVYGRVARPFE